MREHEVDQLRRKVREMQRLLEIAKINPNVIPFKGEASH